MNTRNLSFLLTLCATAFAAGDWPQWRGPNRDGVLPATAEPKSWPAQLNRKWKIQTGIGHSSPILANGAIYVFSRHQNNETLAKIDPKQGTALWTQSYPAPYRMNSAAQSHGEGPKSTPLFHQGRVYTFGISGILSSWDAGSGALKWRKEFSSEFKQTSPIFGTAMSPVIDRGLLIAHIGGNDDGALTAFELETGNVRWQWKGDGPAYASPIIVEAAGVRLVVTQSQGNIIGVSAQDGKLLWKIPFTTPYVQNIVTPLVYKDTLIFSGLSNDTMAVRIVKKGEAWSPDVVWRNKHVSMYMNSPVLSGGLLFGFSHKNKGQYFCLDPRTGETRWQGDPRQGENAAMLIGTGSLLMLNNDGELIVAKPSGSAFEQIRKYKVADSATWAHPLPVPSGFVIKDVSTLAFWSWE